MTQENLLTVLVVTGAWVVLELLKYAYTQLLVAATKNKNKSEKKGGNPGDSHMSAGELRGHLTDVKSLLGRVLDATNAARGYAKQTLEEVKR